MINTNYGVLNALIFLNLLIYFLIFNGHCLSIINDPIKIPIKKYNIQCPNK